MHVPILLTRLLKKVDVIQANPKNLVCKSWLASKQKQISTQTTKEKITEIEVMSHIIMHQQISKQNWPVQKTKKASVNAKYCKDSSYWDKQV